MSNIAPTTRNAPTFHGNAPARPVWKEFCLVTRNATGEVENLAAFSYNSEHFSHTCLPWFIENVGLISCPPPSIQDPTGITGIGFDGLPWPHDEYCVKNKKPELGYYVYPFGELMKYVAIDGMPYGMSRGRILRELRCLAEKAAVDSLSEQPRVAIELPQKSKKCA